MFPGIYPKPDFIYIQTVSLSSKIEYNKSINSFFSHRQQARKYQELYKINIWVTIYTFSLLLLTYIYIVSPTDMYAYITVYKLLKRRIVVIHRKSHVD